MKTIGAREAFESAMQKTAFQNLLVLIVKHGVPQSEAAQLCVNLAEVARSLPVEESLRPIADMTALHYEDMANMLFGGSHLARDPKA